MAGEKYWKISRVVMVIKSENIVFITNDRRPPVINPIFSQVMTITRSDIFQYFGQPCNNYIHKLVVKWPQIIKFFANHVIMDIILLYEFHIASRGQNTYTPLLKQNFKFSHRKFFMTKKSFTLGHIKVSDFCGSDVSGLECQRARKKSCVAALLRVIIKKKIKKS